MLKLNDKFGGIKFMAHENNKMHHEPTRYTINQQTMKTTLLYLSMLNLSLKCDLQGPFRTSDEVWQQRHKPLKPTLRVATSYEAAEDSRWVQTTDIICHYWRLHLTECKPNFELSSLPFAISIPVHDNTSEFQ